MTSASRWPSGTFPFGSPLRSVEQADRRPKRVFVLGVYASAVHATWIAPDGRTLVRALAVASEPDIFWDGRGGAEIIGRIEVPEAAGRLEPAATNLNGPSGRSLDELYLARLGIDRSDAWLCDLVPHTCLNDGQAKALAREYEPRREALGLPEVDLPPVAKTFADDARRQAILDELAESNAEVLVLLGDQPIKHFLAPLAGGPTSLAEYGDRPESYGRPHPVTLGERELHVLPLAHPRQASALGSHSAHWKGLHEGWGWTLPA